MNAWPPARMQELPRAASSVLFHNDASSDLLRDDLTQEREVIRPARIEEPRMRGPEARGDEEMVNVRVVDRHESQ